MPSFNEHVDQCAANLQFLSNINSTFPSELNWKVTLVYYSALHLLHAHEDKEQGLHPMNHVDLKGFLVSNLPNPVYDSYEKLENQSRASRYDCRSMTEKTLAKALDRLDDIVSFFKTKYNTTPLSCPDIYISDKKYVKNLIHFKILERI
jgi:hypothetical protein